ncbi:MAG: thiamine diphosphokinase [Bacteroidales bacterium]|nr:thiamine diphosphokinase [Bacteroidales bacterium]
MSKTAVIIGGGEYPKKPYPLYIIERADYVVCCDSALGAYLRHSRKILGAQSADAPNGGTLRLPDAVIGDMDSLSPALKKRYGHLIVHIPEQETNDQTKAFHHVLEKFPDVGEIFFMGATGKREDHTIGNISLLMEYCREVEAKGVDVNLSMVSDYSTIFPLTRSTSIECGVGRRISLLTPDNSLRIRSKGLEWPTDEVVFDNWWKATLNRSTEDTVSLEFSHNSMVIVIMD